MPQSDDGDTSDTIEIDTTQIEGDPVERNISEDDNGINTRKASNVSEKTPEPAVDDFDDDDFGDFEEATVSSHPHPIQEPEDPFPETPTKEVNFGFAKFEESPKLTPQISFEAPVRFCRF